MDVLKIVIRGGKSLLKLSKIAFYGTANASPENSHDSKSKGNDQELIQPNPTSHPQRKKNTNRLINVTKNNRMNNSFPTQSICFYLFSILNYKTTKQDWLVGCFGLNGPLRQYFSLYRAVSQRQGERKREMIGERKNVQTTPTRTHCKRSRPLPYYDPN